MNALVLMQQAETGGQVQQIANTFGVDWPHLTAQIISFCIVCLLLHRFAYKPILKMLEERQRQIAQGLADAEKIKAELAQTETQRHEIMILANAQATKLIEEAQRPTLDEILDRAEARSGGSLRLPQAAKAVRADRARR